jgi:hypothetical protein
MFGNAGAARAGDAMSVSEEGEQTWPETTVQVRVDECG